MPFESIGEEWLDLMLVNGAITRDGEMVEVDSGHVVTAALEEAPKRASSRSPPCSS